VTQDHRTSLAFQSREQLMGEKAMHKSDVWSLGVIVYLMATFKLPYIGPSAKMNEIVQNQVPEEIPA